MNRLHHLLCLSFLLAHLCLGEAKKANELQTLNNKNYPDKYHGRVLADKPTTINEDEAEGSEGGSESDDEETDKLEKNDGTDKTDELDKGDELDKSDEPEKSDDPDKSDDDKLQTENSDKLEKSDKVDESDKLNKTEKFNKTVKSKESDNSEKTVKSDHLDEADKLDKSDKIDKPIKKSDKSDKIDTKSDKSDKLDKNSDKSDKLDKSEELDKSDKLDKSGKPPLVKTPWGWQFEDNAKSNNESDSGSETTNDEATNSTIREMVLPPSGVMLIKTSAPYNDSLGKVVNTLRHFPVQTCANATVTLKRSRSTGSRMGRSILQTLVIVSSAWIVS